MGCTDASDLRVYFSVSCTFLVFLRQPGEGAGGTTGFLNPEDEDEDEDEDECSNEQKSANYDATNITAKQISNKYHNGISNHHTLTGSGR